MIEFHEHPVYAESRDVESAVADARYDLERSIDDERNDRRATREELLAEIEGLRRYVDEVVAELAELQDLTKRVTELEQKLPTVYEVHDLAGRLDDQREVIAELMGRVESLERSRNAMGGV